jgi:hypothetical protein
MPSASGLIWYHLILFGYPVSFSCLIAFVKNSSTLWNKSSEIGLPCLFPGLTGKTFSSFFFFLLWFCLWFYHIITFFVLGYISFILNFLSFFFYHDKVLNVLLSLKLRYSYDFRSSFCGRITFVDLALRWISLDHGQWTFSCALDSAS